MFRNSKRHLIKRKSNNVQRIEPKIKLCDSNQFNQIIKVKFLDEKAVLLSEKLTVNGQTESPRRFTEKLCEYFRFQTKRLKLRECLKICECLKIVWMSNNNENWKNVEKCWKQSKSATINWNWFNCVSNGFRWKRNAFKFLSNSLQTHTHTCNVSFSIVEFIDIQRLSDLYWDWPIKM